MLSIIGRYIMGDLLRVVALTTTVLVTVIAFGAAIKPLTDESLLGFGQTLRYVTLAMVPMLQFALPFSAGFAATIAIHRMASDNEIVALAASGVSYRRLLLPVAALGLALTIAMVLLTQWIIPRFWALMEQTIATDVTKLFQVSIAKGRAFEVGDLQIYADRLVVDENPPGTTADTRLVMLGVAAAELGASGEIVTDITAAEAWVDIYREGGRTVLAMVLNETLAFKRTTGELVSAAQIEPRPFPVPTLIKDEPMSKTRGELLQLRERPDDYSDVEAKRVVLAECLRDHEVWAELDCRLSDEGVARLTQRGPETRMLEIRADRLVGGALRRDGGRPIEVRQLRGGDPLRDVRAASARLERRPGGALGDLSFDVVLTDCEVTDLAGTGSVNRRSQLAFSNLVLAQPLAEELLELASAELLERAAAIESPGPEIARAVARLEDRLDNLRWDIEGELQYRYALSTTAILLMLLGATLAMHLRHALPLTIYLLAFTPSVADLILISGGQQMIRDGQWHGHLVLWSGNAMMLVLLLVAYHRLSRH